MYSTSPQVPTRNRAARIGSFSPGGGRHLEKKEREKREKKGKKRGKEEKKKKERKGKGSL
jgi:hypothetical protein